VDDTLLKSLTSSSCGNLRALQEDQDSPFDDKTNMRPPFQRDILKGAVVERRVPRVLVCTYYQDRNTDATRPVCSITRSRAASRIAACALDVIGRPQKQRPPAWICLGNVSFASVCCFMVVRPLSIHPRSWYALPRIVGPDRPGTWPPQSQRHCGQAWWVYRTFLCRTTDS
jgi:hypothetical protein